MSFDLSALRFQVDTQQLDDAITKVGNLSTSVKSLSKPIKEVPKLEPTVPDSTVKRQGKNLDVMGQAVKTFYKEQEKFAKQEQKLKEQMFSAGATMNDNAVKSYHKYLDDSNKAQQKATDKRIREMERETDALQRETKKQQTILERQRDITAGMASGLSKGQASIVARAKAAGQGTDVPDIITQVQTQQKFKGGEPFDKSVEGLKTLKQELGQAREGYRQLTEYTEKYEKLKAEGKGEEVSLIALNKKETDNLYRDKIRLLEVYKQEKAALIASGAEEEKLHEKRKSFQKQIRDIETGYKSTATQKRPIDNLRTVDATKRRDELNYLARATSVQLGDVGISLAGGQNPLTVFLQQGDQLRGVFNQVGASSVEMKDALSRAFSQIVVGFVDVAKVMGTFVVGAITDASKAMVKFGLDAVGATAALKYLTEGGTLLGITFKGLGEDHGFTKFIKTVSPAVLGLVSAGLFGLVAAAVAVGVAYSNILPVQKELTAALIQNGASLATSAKDAMQMSAAMASASGTSLDYAKVITEIASAGNLSKESIKGVTSSAVEMNRYLGVATKDVVAQYSKLADDPVKVLTEIGMATGLVTSATIDHIRELVEQGKKTEAVAEANRELDRTYAEMSASAKDSMTPLGRLWDDIKGSINQAIEEVYAFAQTDAVVSGLTTIWEALKVSIMEVAFVIRTVGKELGGIAAQAGAVAEGFATGRFLDGIKSAGRIGTMMREDAEEASRMQTAATNAVVNHNSELAKGISVNNLITQAQLDAQKATGSAIKGSLAWEEQKKNYSTASRLDSKARVDAANKEKAAVKALFEEQKKSLIGQGARGEIKPEAAAKKLKSLKQDLDSFNFAIDEKYKPKKGSGGDSAARDALSAEQQSFENLRKQAERNAKTKQADLDSARNLELVNSYMYIDEKYAIDKEYIEASLGTLKDELKIAYEKKKSLKEIADYKGKIEAEEYKLNERKLERDRAIAEHSGKAAIEMRNAAMQEIATLVEKNKAQKLDNELIGKTQEEIAGIKAARLDHVIALQQEHVAYMEKNGYNETSSTAYGLEKEKLDALIESRKLNVDAINAEVMATFKGYEKEINPTTVKSEEASLVIGEESKKQAAYNDTARVAIEATAHIAKSKMDLAMLDESTTQAQLDSYQKIIDSAALMNEELTTKFSQSVKIDGLDKIASQFESMSKAAGGMGEGFKRATSALSGFSGAFKNLAAAEKNHKKGSNEYIQAQIGGYGDMAGAAAGFFEENSAGYEMMKAAEQGFRAVQLALSIAAMIQGKVETTSAVADSATKGTASMWAGVAKAFEQLGVFGFIGAGAILAFLGSKFGGGGGGSIGTAGAGNQIDSSGRKATYKEPDDGEPTNYDPTTGGYTKQNKPQLTDAEVKARADAAAIDAAANAVANLRIEAMKLTAGSEELEQSLARARLAAGGMGKAHHELATQGMSEAELASYNYNHALKAQLSVQMDIANGTSNTSENMKKLASESRKLAIDLLMASGDIVGARAMQRDDDTVGYTKEEIAVYDHIQRQKEQIEAANAGATAAREAAQAEEQLAQARYELAGQLNILLGRTTQLEFDRATQLAATSDTASIEMMKLIFQLEDLASAVDASYATLERSIAAERKLAETRLQSAVALQTILKSAKEATSPKLTRANAQANLKVLLALAKSSGVLPSADALAPSLATLREPSEGLFSTFVDYQRDFLRTANDINDMSYLADKQVSMEQQTIDKLDAQLLAAKAQLDALKGVDTSVKDVTTAVNDFNAAMQALAAKKEAVGNYTYAPPVVGGGSSGGGGGSGGGAAAGAAKPKFEDIVGQTNKDIVAAYREYYNRNPDESGYEFLSKSLLKGDKLMQAILGASSGNPESVDYKTAVSKGYNPMNPIDKYLKSILQPNDVAASAIDDTASFAVGINNVPEDMTARIHKGERILPAADNRELFARLQNPEENAAVLAAAVARLTDEVKLLRAEQRQTVVNTGDTSRMLKRLGGEEDILTVKVQA